MIIILIVTICLLLQGLFTIYWMIYAWEDPKEIDKHRSPFPYSEPKYTFTVLIPAKDEPLVIADTLWSISRIHYPHTHLQVILICHISDQETILAAQSTMYDIEDDHLQMVIYEGEKQSKPKALNVALQYAQGDIIGVFDAEDEPHPDIIKVVNTVLLQTNADVVQSGVQLMNLGKPWFSTFNVLEYFFWFKSALHLFTKIGVTPLGGNTVFIKKERLMQVKGWDENALTEDADIGIRLASLGANIKVVYDEKHVTREETPPSLAGFIRQRTRWNHGFLQVLLKRDWWNLDSIVKKLFTIYILLSPLIQTLFFLYLPLSIWLTLTKRLPVSITLISFLPFYLLILQLVILIVGLYEFTRAYKFKFSIFQAISVIAFFYPYQLVLGIAAVRAVFHLFTKSLLWEKTLHINAHRNQFSK